MAKRTVEVLIKGKDQTKQATSSAGKGFNDLNESLAKNAKLLAGFGAAAVAAMGAAATAVFSFLDSTSQMEDQLAKAAKRAQTDIQTYGEWGHVLQLAGANAGDFEKAMAALARQMVNAERGSLESVEAFSDLGISIHDAEGNLKTADNAFAEIVDSLSKMEDKTKRAGLAQVLLGRAGKTMIPVLNETTESIKAQREEWSRLGGSAIVQAAETGEAWVDAQLRVKTANDGLRASFLSAFGPATVAIINGTAEAIATLGENLEDVDTENAVSSIDDFFKRLNTYVATIPATVKLFKDVTNAVGEIELDPGSDRIPELLGRITESIIGLDQASARANLAERGLKLTFPDADKGAEQLKTYNDLMRISRKELEELAKTNGIDITGKVAIDPNAKLEIPGIETDPVDIEISREGGFIDVAKTSEQIAQELAFSYIEGAKKAGPDIRKELEKIAASYGISSTVKIFDEKKLKFIDKEKTSDQLAKEITKAAADAVAKSQEDVKTEVAKIGIGVTEGLREAAESFGIDVYERVWDPVFQQMIDAEKGAETLTRQVEAAYKLSMENANFIGPIPGPEFETANADELAEGMDAAALAAQNLGDATGEIFVDAPFRAMQGDVVKLSNVLRTTLMAALKAVIRQLLVVRAIEAFGGFLGLKSGGTVPENLGQGPIGFAKGGSIPRAAHGYAVPDGPRGRDSRLILAEPGEEVVNRELSQRLDRYLTAAESAAYASPYGSGMGSGSSGTVVMNVGIPDSMAGLERMKTGIQESLASGGEA